MLNLPFEILTDIFLQLPTKSLGRCKCVCKSWCSLISNPEFANLHLNRAIPGKNKLGLFLVHPLPPPGLGSQYRLENVDINGHPIRVHPSNFPDYTLPKINVEIVGSCNGLICLLYYPNRFVLWNPTINEPKEIPHSPNFIDDYEMLFYGFGYDSLVDDYKLVRNIGSISTSTNLFEIYSLKDNSWRSIEHDSNIINIDIETKSATFLNGALHWAASRGMNQRSKYKNYDLILVFDIKRFNFEFWEIVAPRHDRCYEIKLGVLRGCLSLYSYEEVQVILVWVMKDYGVSESWTWLVTLPLDFFLLR